MKKVISFIFAILLCSFIFAQNENQQKVWSVDDDIYKYLTALYVAEGHAMPNGAGPWSSEEINRMLDAVESVQAVNESLYNEIKNRLNQEARFSTKDGLKFSVNGFFNPEMYAHTNSEDFCYESDWNYDFEKRKEVAGFELEGFVGKNFYKYSEYGMSRVSYCAVDKDGNSVETEKQKTIFAPAFMSNLPYAPLKGFTGYSVNFPSRAILAAGGDHWNIAMGRDVLRWGHGETGNLMLGGNAVYDNNIRFSAFYNSFKYTMAYIFYPHSQNLYKRYPDSTYKMQNQSVDGIRVYMAHRMDVRVLRDKINLSIAEGVLYQNATGSFDVSYFNPVNLFHNYYIRGNGNSIMALEADYTPFKNWNLYGQVVIDESASIGEPDGSDENAWRPSKQGYLAGGKYVKNLPVGILKLNLEGVYTTPYLYLREAYNAAEGNQGCSLIGYVREFQTRPEIGFIRNYIGYKYGGDCAVADFKADLDSVGKWSGGFELFYMAHGIIDYETEGDSDWIIGKGDFLATTDKRVKGQYSKELCNDNSGSIESLFRISLLGKYQILDWMGIYGGLDNWFVWNKDNVESSMVYDCQTYLGMRITF